MKKASKKLITRSHDDFFMRMGAACLPDAGAGNSEGDFEKQNAELLSGWLEYNAAHGKKARKGLLRKKDGK
jgi:hypothetical protein